MTETQSTTAITEVATVIVPVADQDRALEFYVETLGFEKRMDMPYGDGNRWLEVVPPMFFFRDVDGNSLLIVEEGS